MGTLHQSIHNPNFPLAGTAAFRLSSRLLDVVWIFLAIGVLPNVLIFCLFGYSAEFFRGWMNAELGLVFAALLTFRSSGFALALLAVEPVADLLEPIAHVFYFRPLDAIHALRFLEVLPVMRLALYGIGLAAYVCAMLLGFTTLSRRVKDRRFASLVIVALVLTASAIEVATGRYSTVSHSDARRSRMLLIRTPVASIVSRTLNKGPVRKSQQIDSCFRHLSAAQETAIVHGRMNIVSVLVESWGLFNDPTLRSGLAAPLTTQAIAARYHIDSGSVPFVGSTIFGESRNLCGAIFDRPLEEVSPARLEQCYPAHFERLGYSTLAIHGFYPHMYGRDHWLPEVGFQQELFQPELKKMGMSSCRGGLVGICDDDIAGFIHARLTNAEGPEPLFVHWTTLDSHLPIDVTADTLRDADCSSASGLGSDGSLCVWYSLVHKVNAEVAQIALDKTLPRTVFLVVGDHAPPFYNASRRAEFSQDRVPYVILTPRS